MEILLIEDNPGDIILVQLALDGLDGLNVELITKTSGKLASSYIKQASRCPDLVILDINLPHKSGLDILREMKDSSMFCGAPVVIFTSSYEEQDKLKAMSLGARAFITKPMDLEEYKRQVVSFLDLA